MSFNAKENKYGFVELTRRFGNVQMPTIELVDIKEKRRKREMKGNFSDNRMLHEISNLNHPISSIRTHVFFRSEEKCVG